MQDQATEAGAPAAGESPAGGTVSGTKQESKTVLVQKLEQHGPAALGVIVLMAVAWILAGWARATTRRALAKTKFDPTLGKFFSNMLRWAILVIAVVTSLQFFGITATSFAAVIGAVTLAIGLGFQNSLSNLAAGVMLLIFRPFKVGDMVNVAGQLGKVNEIDLLMTEIDTPDGRRIILPNGQVFGNIIENITHHPRRRVDIAVGVSYEADIDATRAALLAAARAVSPRIDDPAPEVALTGLGASSVDWAVRVWTLRENFGATREATLRAVKLSLDGAGISIPYLQLDVHLRAAPGSERTVRVVLPESAGEALKPR
jgi:small conductance mechanosensitive channel